MEKVVSFWSAYQLLVAGQASIICLLKTHWFILQFDPWNSIFKYLQHIYIYILCSEELSSQMFITYFDLIHHPPAHLPPQKRKKNPKISMHSFKWHTLEAFKSLCNTPFQDSELIIIILPRRLQNGNVKKEAVNMDVKTTCHLVNASILSISLHAPPWTSPSPSPFHFINQLAA